MQATSMFSPDCGCANGMMSCPLGSGDKMPADTAGKDARLYVGQASRLSYAPDRTHNPTFDCLDTTFACVGAQAEA